MIKVYTDASTEGNIGVAASIIQDKHKLIKVLIKEYPIIGPSAAEIYGILQCVKYLNKIKVTERILLFTDLETAIRAFNNLKDNPGDYKDVAYPQVWRQIMRNCKNLNIEFLHTKAHWYEAGCNSACDRLAVYTRKHLDTLKEQGLIE